MPFVKMAHAMTWKRRQIACQSQRVMYPEHPKPQVTQASSLHFQVTLFL
jgi:hypothetical protein